jgi:hypothetical protein
VGFFLDVSVCVSMIVDGGPSFAGMLNILGVAYHIAII